MAINLEDRAEQLKFKQLAKEGKSITEGINIVSDAYERAKEKLSLAPLARALSEQEEAEKRQKDS